MLSVKFKFEFQLGKGNNGKKSDTPKNSNG